MQNNDVKVQTTKQSSRTFMKGLLIGGLILGMLIPTIFIQGIINEREARQKEVVKEVSSKWASNQTLSGPFITVPYTDTILDVEGKTLITTKHLIILCKNLEVNGSMIPEVRPRSIYKVLLYKSDLIFSGSFKTQWPAGVNSNLIDFSKATICFSLSDFKGIEEDMSVTINGTKLSLVPGLPVTDFGAIGVSAPVSLNLQSFADGFTFSLPLKLKGSEQLHFLPLSESSTFNLKSTIANPSFDGNILPSERTVSDNGFAAQWKFNRANLPFPTVLTSGNFKDINIDFGVSLVQPVDQYNKTSRSVKYAILLIGLSFALFFIIELMQKKPLHPIQYVLVGIALVIFYILLLSISEFILFDRAYLIAAASTVLLITMYTKSHFKSMASTATLALVLSGLYGFVFVLIRLEDTALLVGSIGLFVVLALVMYASRKIKWYGETVTNNLA